MIKFSNASRILLLSTVITIMSGHVCKANTTQDKVNQAIKTLTELKAVNIKQSKKANYKITVLNGKDVAVITVNGKEIMNFSNPAGSSSVEERAKIITNRLNDFIKNKENPRLLRVGLYNGGAVAKYGETIIFSIDKETADEEKLTGFTLAHKWVNNFRTSLGAPKLLRETNETIASRSIIPATFNRAVYSTTGKMQQVGTASWYGGKFHGRRAADGTIFNKHEMTAAHKTLPFGTRVKVTNLKNGKTCVVRISDRGPFIAGRIIDLSAAAAKEIGIHGSGIGKVKIETVE